MNATSPKLAKVFRQEAFPDPRAIRWLFGDPRAAFLWTPLRLYLGWQWLTAGLEKVENPAWTRTGTALQGFLAAATKGVPGQKGAAIHYGWYHDFLLYMLNHHWYTWFGKLVAFGETAVGIALILGAFTGIAAFFGAFMNFNYLLAGTSSTNPLLFLIAILLLLAWKVAGFIGADYILLPTFGTPWRVGRIAGVSRVGAERFTTGRLIGTTALFLVSFGITGVVAVVVNNAWASSAPWGGYLLCLAMVGLAWLVTVEGVAISAIRRRQSIRSST
jgi:thiosulfate dehydrogenase [quinone] large subunit